MSERRTKILFEDEILIARCDEEALELIHTTVIPRWDNLGITGQLFALLRHPNKNRTLACGHNLVTDPGDEFYAARAAIEQPADNRFTNGAAPAFDGILELGTAGTAPAKTHDRSDISAYVTSSQKAMDGTYPQTNDGDADNPGTVGVDIVTYRVSYTTGEANNGAIDRAFITNPSPAASEPLLSYGTITSFAKTSSDTLKFFWNQRMNGV